MRWVNLFVTSFHALTASDSTNAFFKIGKKLAWQIFY